MLLLAVLKLLSEKLIRIDVTVIKSQFLFNLIKTKRTDFLVSIEPDTEYSPKIQDELTDELYACCFYLVNKNRNKKAALRRIINLLGRRNSDSDNGYPHKFFVNSILDKYKAIDRVLFKPAKAFGLLGTRTFSLEKALMEKLTTELKASHNAIEQTNDPLTLKFIEAVKKITSRAI